MKPIEMILVLFSLLLSSASGAQDLSRGSLDASTVASQVMGSVVLGAAALVVVTGALTITAVEKTADGVSIVMEGASETIKVSVPGTSDAAGDPKLAVGQTVHVVQEATGTALMLAGKIVAFFPNDIGKSLIHHSRVGWR